MSRIAGLGCRPGTPPEALRDALSRAEEQAGPACALATIPERAREVRAMGHAIPLHFVRVAGVQTPTQSDRVLARFGTGSVAEAAALVAAGPGARLIATRSISACGRATAAIAEGSDP